MLQEHDMIVTIGIQESAAFQVLHVIKPARNSAGRSLSPVPRISQAVLARPQACGFAGKCGSAPRGSVTNFWVQAQIEQSLQQFQLEKMKLHMQREQMQLDHAFRLQQLELQVYLDIIVQRRASVPAFRIFTLFVVDCLRWDHRQKDGRLCRSSAWKPSLS